MLTRHKYLAGCFVMLLGDAAAGQNLPDPSNGPSGAAYQFYANNGQLLQDDSNLASSIQYYTERGSQKIFIGDDRISYVHYQKGDTATAVPDSVLRLDMQFASNYTAFDQFDVNPFNTSVEEQSADSLNFYLPHCPNGIVGVPGYGRVIMKDVYGNIDVHYYSNNSGPVFYVVIRPGGSPSDIAIKFTGQDSMKSVLNNLYLYLNGRPMTFATATAYELDNSNNTSLLGWQPQWWSPDSVIAKIIVGSYDPTQTLVLKVEAPPAAGFGQPKGLEWCTYYGDQEDDEAVAVTNGGDNSEDIYTVANIESGNYPTHSGAFPAQQIFNYGSRDLYISKFDAAHARIWSTYFGSAGRELASKAVGSSNGWLYVAGQADGVQSVALLSPGSGAFQQSYNAAVVNGLLLAFNKTNGTKQWVTFINGNGGTEINSVYKDRTGKLYVAGATLSTQFTGSCTNSPAAGSFPLCSQIGAYNQGANSGGLDGFIMEFNESNFQLNYATLIGGDGEDAVADVATGDGVTGGIPWHKVFFVGTTTTTTVAKTLTYNPLLAHPGSGVFPVASPSSSAYLQATRLQTNGQLYDCFVGYLNTANALEWSTFYGGDGDEWSRSITISNLGSNANNNIYIGGTTSTKTGASTSGQANTLGHFPIYGAGNAFSQGVFGYALGKGQYDAFLAGFTQNGNLIWSTYFGEELDERDWKLADRRNGGVIKCDQYGNILYAGTSQRVSNCTFCSVPTYLGGQGTYQQNQNASWSESLSGQDAFLCMFRPDHRLRWATNYGGNGSAPNSPNSTDVADEMLRDLAITNGSSGSRVYLKLTTLSTQTPKPTCPTGAYCNEQTFGGQNYDAFIACFNYNSIADPVANSVPCTGSGTERFGLQIFPKPASQALRCRFIAQRAGDIRLACYDALGRLVKTFPITALPGNNELEIDINSLSPGTYCLRIADQSFEEHGIFIKN